MCTETTRHTLTVGVAVYNLGLMWLPNMMFIRFLPDSLFLKQVDIGHLGVNKHREINDLTGV